MMSYQLSLNRQPQYLGNINHDQGKDLGKHTEHFYAKVLEKQIKNQSCGNSFEKESKKYENSFEKQLIMRKINDLNGQKMCDLNQGNSLIAVCENEQKPYVNARNAFENGINSNADAQNHFKNGQINLKSVNVYENGQSAFKHLKNAYENGQITASAKNYFRNELGINNASNNDANDIKTEQCKENEVKNTLEFYEINDKTNVTRSCQSSPTGDSGVSSEPDSPQPTKKHAQVEKKLSFGSEGNTETMSKSSSSVSDDFDTKAKSVGEESAIVSDDKDNSNKKVTKTRRKSIQHKPTCKIVYLQKKAPDQLLKEIKEKAKNMKKRRKVSFCENKSATYFARATSFHKSQRITRPPFNSPCNMDFAAISLTNSSSSSSTSLSNEEEDAFQPFPFENHISKTYLRKSIVENNEYDEEENDFAGVVDFFAPQRESAILSAKGTVRGVKNRVRLGIATFTSDHRLLRLYSALERGKMVVYVSTLGVVRETYEKCSRLRKILWNLLVKYEEKDIFMSRENQIQLLDRLQSRTVCVPHVFVEGQYLGSVDLIEQLNETGDLRKIIQPYMMNETATKCDTCGGFSRLPCTVCNGSKKSVHRNHFTAEFLSLKCSLCDESGLVTCPDCLRPT